MYPSFAFLLRVCVCRSHIVTGMISESTLPTLAEVPWFVLHVHR